MDQHELRSLIRSVLDRLALQMDEPNITGATATELLMITAAVEELLPYEYAGGIFGIAPATYDELYFQYFNYQGRKYRHVISGYYAPLATFEQNIVGNLPFQIGVARLLYWRVAEALPANNVLDLSEYYRKYWPLTDGGKTNE